MNEPEFEDRDEVSVADALAALADLKRPVDEASLCALSNLVGEDVAKFTTAWPLIDAERRLAIMRGFAELASERYELVFRQAARIALQDDSDAVRAAAIVNLAAEEHPGLIAPLVSVLSNDPYAPARAAAANCLGVFVYRGELDELSGEMRSQVESVLFLAERDDPEADVRNMALASLGYSSKKNVAARIQAAGASTDPARLAAALRAMGRSADEERWGEAVLARLTHDSPIVRREAAQAAGELELSAAVDELAEMLYATTPELQETAIWALGEIGGATARSKLIELQAVAEADEWLQSAIEEALSILDLMAGDFDPGVLHVKSFAKLIDEENAVAADDLN